MCVLDDVVVGPGHVAGGQRLAVLPLGVLADREGPDLAVGAGRPAGREAGGLVRRHVGRVQTDEGVVVHVPDGERRRGRADERVEVVGAGGPAQPEDDLAVGRRRAGARGERRRHAPDEAGQQGPPSPPAGPLGSRTGVCVSSRPPCSVGVRGPRARARPASPCPSTPRDTSRFYTHHRVRQGARSAAGLPPRQPPICWLERGARRDAASSTITSATRGGRRGVGMPGFSLRVAC